jgi:hypothetical protein
MAAIVVEKPRFPLVPLLIQDLNAAVALFEKGSAKCRIRSQPVTVRRYPAINLRRVIYLIPWLSLSCKRFVDKRRMHITWLILKGTSLHLLSG